MGIYLRDGLIELPEDLVRKHEEGNVVFFCGAGISMPAGLPNFEKLVKSVCESLGENGNLENDFLEDRLYQLEQKYKAPPKSVRGKVFEVLTKDVKEIRPYHSSLLQLSTHKGKVRLVTTNFDTLFDKEIKAQKLKNIKSYTAPFLPYSLDWNGIVYLHGKLPQNKNQLEELNELILTSADFGKAYITERYAARFLLKLLKNYTICFVGYAANDKIMKFILDAWAEEREKLNLGDTIYAFAPYENESNKSDESKKWELKSVTPLLYPTQDNHRCLVETLSAWAERYKNGTLGKSVQINEILVQDPTVIVSSKIDSLYVNFCDVNAVRIALNNQSSSMYIGEWVKLFLASKMEDVKSLSKYKIKKVFRSKEYSFSLLNGRTFDYKVKDSWFNKNHAFEFDASELAVILQKWICNQIRDPNLLSVFLPYANHISLDFLKNIENSIKKEKKLCPSWLVNMWKYIFKHQFECRDEWFDVESYITSGKNPPPLGKKIVPKLKVKMDGGRPPHIKVIFPLHFSFSNYDTSLSHSLNVPSQWVKTLEDYLNSILLLHNKLRKNEQAQGIDKKYFTCESLDYIPAAIEAHAQNDFFRLKPVAIIISLLRDSWLTLLKESPQKASDIAIKWARSKDVIWQRFFLFAISQKEILIPFMDWIDFLIENDGEKLYNLDLYHEIMVLFRHKNKDFKLKENQTSFNKLKCILENDDADSILYRLLGQLNNPVQEKNDARFDRREFLIWNEFTGDKYISQDQSRIAELYRKDPIKFFTNLVSSTDNKNVQLRGIDDMYICHERDSLWYSFIKGNKNAKSVIEILNQVYLNSVNMENPNYRKSKHQLFLYFRTVLSNWDADEFLEYYESIWSLLKKIIEQENNLDEINYSLVSWVKSQAERINDISLIKKILHKLSIQEFDANNINIFSLLHTPIAQLVQTLITSWNANIKGLKDIALIREIVTCLEDFIMDDHYSQITYCVCFYNLAFLINANQSWVKEHLFPKLLLKDEKSTLYWRCYLSSYNSDALFVDKQIQEAFLELRQKIGDLKDEKKAYLYVFSNLLIKMPRSEYDNFYYYLRDLLLNDSVPTKILTYIVRQVDSIEDENKKRELYTTMINPLFEFIFANCKDASIELPSAIDCLTRFQEEERNNFFKLCFEGKKVKFNRVTIKHLQSLSNKEYSSICIQFMGDISKQLGTNLFKKHFDNIKDKLKDEMGQKLYDELSLFFDSIN